MSIAFDAPVYYEFTFRHGLLGNPPDSADTNSMYFPHFLSSNLIHRLMFTDMILFSKAMLGRLIINYRSYGALQLLTDSFLPLAAADDGPQIDAVVIAETGLQKARTRQAQAVTGRAEA